MNRQQLEVWLEAMLAQHAAGKLSTALLRGAFDVADEVRRQWGRLAVERSQARYTPSGHNHQSLAQRLDQMEEEAREQVYRNPSLRPLERPEQPKVSATSWFSPATMQRLHAASLQILRKMEAPISWSVCSRCGDFRAKGVIRIPERDSVKNAYLYASAAEPRVWRWMADVCGAKRAGDTENHHWQPTTPPDWAQNNGDAEGGQS